MHNRPKISYLVTFYNAKDYVKPCLDSILSQDDSPSYEVLLGDDGSTDGTKELLMEYVAQYPDVMRLYSMQRDPEDKSLGRTRMIRNRMNLLRHAQGQYISIPDGDDYISYSKFAKESVDFLDANPQYMAYGYEIQYDINGKITPVPSGIPEGELSPLVYLPSKYVSAASFVFRNVTTPDEIAELEAKNAFSDNGITLFFMNKGPLWHVNTPAYTYRQMENSTWTSTSELGKQADNASWLPTMQFCIPKHKYLVVSRCNHALRGLWRNRRTAGSSISGNVLKRIQYQASVSNFHFVVDILNWPGLSFGRKVMLHFEYLRYRVIAKTAKILAKLMLCFQRHKK